MKRKKTSSRYVLKGTRIQRIYGTPSGTRVVKVPIRRYYKTEDWALRSAKDLIEGRGGTNLTLTDLDTGHTRRLGLSAKAILL